MRPLMLAALALAACHRPAAPGGGDVARGEAVITSYQCGACHEIPGVFNAHGQVGPPLAGFARRTLIAGMLPNTRGNLIHWLRNPQQVTPGNGMPDMGLTDEQARDAAAYLDTLK